MFLDMNMLNNNYNIKIRAFIDDIYGIWSEIKTFNNNQQNFSIFSNIGEQHNKNGNPFSQGNFY